MDRFYSIKFIIVFVALFSLSARAEVSLGINFSTSLDREVRKEEVQQGEEYQRITTYALNLYPSLIIVPTGKFEIVPTFGFTLQKSKRVDEDEDGNEHERYDRTDIGVGGGCGLFFRLIESNVFRLSLGPDVFVLYFNPEGGENETIDVTLGLPVNVDFLLSERLFLRLGSRLVAIRYVYENEGADAHTNTFTFFDIESMLEARLGFFFRF
ncbi:hypothetical protein ACFL5S_00075 [Fibrobacterota bacterium]